MPVTALTAQVTNGAYPALPIGAGTRKLTHVAIDASLGGSVAIIEGKTMVFVFNTGGAPHTVTIASVADSFNRPGDITTYSVPAGEVHHFGPFKLAGWSNAGLLGITVSDVSLEIGILNLP